MDVLVTAYGVSWSITRSCFCVEKTQGRGDHAGAKRRLLRPE